jgi:hypothetical protein
MKTRAPSRDSVRRGTTITASLVLSSAAATAVVVVVAAVTLGLTTWLSRISTTLPSSCADTPACTHTNIRF